MVFVHAGLRPGPAGRFVNRPYKITLCPLWRGNRRKMQCVIKSQQRRLRYSNTNLLFQQPEEYSCSIFSSPTNVCTTLERPMSAKINEGCEGE